MAKPQYILVHPITKALVYPGIKPTLNPYGFMAKIFDITPGKPTTPAAALFHMLSAQNELPRAQLYAPDSDYPPLPPLFSPEDALVRLYDGDDLVAILPESLHENLRLAIRKKLAFIGKDRFPLDLRSDIEDVKAPCNAACVPKTLVPARQFPYIVFSDLGVEAATVALLHSKGLVTIENPLRNFHMIDPDTGMQVHTVYSRNPFALLSAQQQQSQKAFKPVIKLTMDKDPAITPLIGVDVEKKPKANRAKKDIPSDEWILHIHRWGSASQDIYLIGSWSIERLFYPIVLPNILKHLGSPDKPKIAYGPSENQEYRLVRRENVPPEGPGVIILDAHRAMQRHNPDKQDRITYAKKWDRVLGTTRPSFTPVENDINEVYR